MKTVRHTRHSRDPLLHIETEFGIVNIHVGLHDTDGNPVTAIAIIPDRVDWSYEGRTITLDGHSNNRLIARKETP